MWTSMWVRAFYRGGKQLVRVWFTTIQSTWNLACKYKFLFQIKGLRVSHGLLIILVHSVPGEDVEMHALYHLLLRAELRCPRLPIILRRQCCLPGRDVRRVFLVQIWRLFFSVEFKTAKPASGSSHGGRATHWRLLTECLSHLLTAPEKPNRGNRATAVLPPLSRGVNRND